MEPAKGVRVLLCVGCLLYGRVDRKVITRCLVPGSTPMGFSDLAPKAAGSQHTRLYIYSVASMYYTAQHGIGTSSICMARKVLGAKHTP